MIEVKVNKDQKKNLKKLADYLYKLPDNYQHFDMTEYLINQDEYIYEPFIPFTEIRDNPNIIHECNSVGCAIGHGPIAGIPIPEEAFGWEEYSLMAFGCEVMSYNDELYDWLFDNYWKHTDNTSKGAAKRIYWFLEHGGIPDDFEEQKDGDKPLCY